MKRPLSPSSLPSSLGEREMNPQGWIKGRIRTIAQDLWGPPDGNISASSSFQMCLQDASPSNSPGRQCANVGGIQLLSHVQLFVTPWPVVRQVLCPWDFPGRNTAAGCTSVACACKLKTIHHPPKQIGSRQPPKARAGRRTGWMGGTSWYH